MLSLTEFERCLLSWIQAIHEATDGQVIAIDGKTLRGSFDKASIKSAIHIISAQASVNSSPAPAASAFRPAVGLTWQTAEGSRTAPGGTC